MLSVRLSHVRRRPAPLSYSPSGEILDEARHSEGGSCQNALHSAPFSSSPSRPSAMPAASSHGPRGGQQAPANPAPNASMELPLSRCKAPRTQIQPIVYFDPTPGARLSDHLTAPPIGAAHAVYQPRSFPAPTLRSSPLIAPDAVGMIKRSIRKARKSTPTRRPRPSALEAPSPQPMQLTPPEW